MQCLHQIFFFIPDHFLLEQTELICDFWFTEHFQLGHNFFLGIFLGLSCAVLYWIFEILEVALLVMSYKPLQYRVGHFRTLLLEVCLKHFSIELRVEPVLRHYQFAIEICCLPSILHRLEESGNHRPLSARISFVIQIINVYLLVHTLQVYGTRLHGYFGTLLRIRLQ